MSVLLSHCSAKLGLMAHLRTADIDASRDAPEDAILGVDHEAKPIWWATIQVRQLVAPPGRQESTTWIPVYQPTVYMAVGDFGTGIALAVETTLLLFSDRNDHIERVDHELSSPVRDLVRLPDELVVIHEIGVDRFANDGRHAVGEATEPEDDWIRVGDEIRVVRPED